MQPGDAVRPVVIGVVRRGSRVLVARRAPHLHQGGLCEFPGGRIESGESAEEALAREMHEETGLAIRACAPLIHFEWRYDDRRLFFHVFEVRDFAGELRRGPGGMPAWVGVDDLRTDDFPPANRPMIAALNLPDRYLVTPEVEHERDFIACFTRALERGVRLAVLRCRRREDAAYAALARKLAATAASFGTRLLLHDRPQLVAAAGAAGVHLSAAALRECGARPVPPDSWFAVSCHDAAELRIAARLGADFAVLGPVASTPTHPAGRPLGWSAFAELTCRPPMPVYAIGGMSARDLPQCRAHGGQGIAALRALWQSA